MKADIAQALVVEAKLSGVEIKPFTKARIAYGFCESCGETVDHVIAIYPEHPSTELEVSIVGNGQKLRQGPAPWTPKAMKCKCGKKYGLYLYERFFEPCQMCDSLPKPMSAVVKCARWACDCGQTQARRNLPETKPRPKGYGNL